MATLAIIGAGMAGLSAGQVLAAQGHDITVFEKSRGPGGRSATRFQEERVFDHGAQYFTAKSPEFQEAVQSWLGAGVVAPWTGRIVSLEATGLVDKTDGPRTRYVGAPGMYAMGKQMAQGLDVRYRTQVAPPKRLDGRWSLEAEGEQLGSFEALLVTAPAAQTAALLSETAPGLAQRASVVAFEPCWTVMATFPLPLPVEFAGAFLHDGPLSWVASNRQRPGRPDHEAWVLHAGAEWTREHLEDSREAVVPALLAAFFEATGIAPSEPDFVTGHRWLYAMPKALDEGFLSLPEAHLAVAGDWCGGPRVEGAWLSGRRAGRWLAESLAQAS